MSRRQPRWVPAVTWRNEADVREQFDLRTDVRDTRSTTWCASCNRTMPDYYAGIRHAAALGHLVETVTTTRTVVATFDAMLDADAPRLAAGR